MKAVVFNILAAGAAALIALEVLLWAHSYWMCDRISYQALRWPEDCQRHTILGFISIRGDFILRTDYLGGNEPPGTFTKVLWQPRRDRALEWTAAPIDVAEGWELAGVPYELHYGAKIERSGVAGPPDHVIPNRDHAIAFMMAPYWALLVPICILPLIWLGRAARGRRRMRRGLCLRCGYDLRATEGCCPECGTPQRLRTQAVDLTIGSAVVRLPRVLARNIVAAGVGAAIAFSSIAVYGIARSFAGPGDTRSGHMTAPNWSDRQANIFYSTFQTPSDCQIDISIKPGGSNGYYTITFSTVRKGARCAPFPDTPRPCLCRRGVSSSTRSTIIMARAAHLSQ